MLDTKRSFDPSRPRSSRIAPAASALAKVLACAALLAAASAAPDVAAAQDEARSREPLRVCATTPDLGALVTAVGGDDVEVTVFTKGTEDPHFTEPRPSFVKALSRADLYVQNGLELELGWATNLLRSARNAGLQLGGPGYVDASAAVEPLEVPLAADRSMGDVHMLGNPHYLLDPVNGVKVARLVAARLEALSPGARERFRERLAAFEARLGAAMVGPELATRYDASKLAVLYAHGRLREFLAQQKERAPLAGWLGAIDEVRARAGAPAGARIRVVADHNLWPYFAARFGLQVVAHLEPKPGISPTTSHLSDVVELMRRESVGALLASVYYNPRYARWVAERTGASVVELAHQVGARPGTDDYVSMVDYNVRTLVGSLSR